MFAIPHAGTVLIRAGICGIIFVVIILEFQVTPD